LAQFFLATLNLDSSLPRIMIPLMIWGVGWALFNAPNQSSILSSVSTDKIGAAAGMIATTARAGGAMGVALSATLFGHLVAAAGFSSSQIGEPENWRAAPAAFMDAFSATIYVLTFSTALAIFFSAVRGQRRTD
jgi:hypothetical protein